MYLYEKIMYNISREVKRALNEDVQNFDVADYQENEVDIIDQDTIQNITFTKLGNKQNEEQAFKKIVPSEKSLKMAKAFENKIKKCLMPLMPLKLSKECLKYNNDSFYLYGEFTIISNYEEGFIDAAYIYAYINFNYNINKNQFELNINTKELAEMIEFCDIYKNRLSFQFTGHDHYYYKFGANIKTPGIIIEDIFIFLNAINDYNIYDVKKPKKFVNQTNKILNKILRVYNEFVEFVPKYLKENNF